MRLNATGKRHTEETREILRQAAITQFQNPEHRTRISEIMKGTRVVFSIELEEFVKITCEEIAASPHLFLGSTSKAYRQWKETHNENSIPKSNH